MNKILQEAADEISNVFALNNGWCDDKRMAVSKIFEAMEAKILQTNNKASAPCVHEWTSGMFSHICKKCGLVDDA